MKLAAHKARETIELWKDTGFPCKNKSWIPYFEEYAKQAPGTHFFGHVSHRSAHEPDPYAVMTFDSDASELHLVVPRKGPTYLRVKVPTKPNCKNYEPVEDSCCEEEGYAFPHGKSKEELYGIIFQLKSQVAFHKKQHETCKKVLEMREKEACHLRNEKRVLCETNKELQGRLGDSQEKLAYEKFRANNNRNTYNTSEAERQSLIEKLQLRSDQLNNSNEKIFNLQRNLDNSRETCLDLATRNTDLRDEIEELKCQHAVEMQDLDGRCHNLSQENRDLKLDITTLTQGLRTWKAKAKHLETVLESWT